jgi:membrane protease subunit HflC
MRKWTIILLLLILASPLLFRLALSTIFFTVDRTEFVYVTQFGKHIATFDGARDTDSGLHWRWPWPIQSVIALDRRLQTFDLPEVELLTHDPKGNTIDRTLSMVAYVCWRIGGNRDDVNEAVDEFIRRVGTPERARAILGQRISSQFGAVIGQMQMDDLVSTDPGKVDHNMDALRTRLMTSLQERARSDYGIDLVDIRLRRHSYPLPVRAAIFDRIKSERDVKVAEYESKGDQEAAHIRSEAERDARNLVTDARAREQQLKSQAEADADRIRSSAHARDVEFYAFLKRLEEYQRILGDNKTVLLLSSHRELFDLLFHPPRPDGRDKSGKPIAGQGPTQPMPTGDR